MLLAPSVRLARLALLAFALLALLYWNLRHRDGLQSLVSAVLSYLNFSKCYTLRHRDGWRFSYQLESKPSCRTTTGQLSEVALTIISKCSELTRILLCIVYIPVHRIHSSHRPSLNAASQFTRGPDISRTRVGRRGARVRRGIRSARPRPSMTSQLTARTRLARRRTRAARRLPPPRETPRRQGVVHEQSRLDTSPARDNRRACQAMSKDPTCPLTFM